MSTSAPTSQDGARRLALESTAAIVTGGSRGIGLAIAAALARGGARVAITGRTQGHLDSAAASAPGIHPIRADVSDSGEAAGAVDEAARVFGGLDLLVNNAGVGHFGHVDAFTDAHWREIIDTNLTGVFNCCRAALPHLRRRGGGWIISISSLAGQNPFAGGAAYCASKAGLNAFSEALMQEVRHDNIRVSCIAPGSVSTGFGGRGPVGGEADWKIAPDDVAELVVDLVTFPARSLPSRIELRPSRPRPEKKS
jgi:NAD(P)-dependent dehydrogenase (short-subunit alcohol dehydrogenase family)